MNILEKIKNIFSCKPATPAQLIQVLRQAQQHQLIDMNELNMMEGVLKVSDKKARDVMVPQAQMVMVEADAFPHNVFPTIVESHHSRFPVIGENRDQVLGILIAKDLLFYAMEHKTDGRRIRDFMRPVVFIPESKRLDMLLKEFRLQRNHMAIVVNEYGGVSGLATMEDVLEQIVGDIEDEYDITDQEPTIKQINQYEYMVKALTPLEDFNRIFQTQFENKNIDTIGGLMSQRFGYLPKLNETIQINGFEVTIVKANRRGIQLLKFKKLSRHVESS